MNTVFTERASPNPMNKWPPESWSVHLLYRNRPWYDSTDDTKTIYKTSCSHCILNRKEFLWFISRGFKSKEREELTQEEPPRMTVVLRILVLARQKLLLQLWKSCLIVLFVVIPLIFSIDCGERYFLRGPIIFGNPLCCKVNFATEKKGALMVGVLYVCMVITRFLKSFHIHYFIMK